VSFTPASSLRIENPEAARVLADPNSLRFLAPFIGRDATASRAAEEVRVSLHRMLYWVRRLSALGLVQVSNAQRRVRAYRAVADAFFVPFSTTDAVTGEQLLERWNRPWQEIFTRSFIRELSDAAPEFGVRVQRGDGGLSVSLASSQERDWNFFDPAAPNVVDGWVTNLHLSPEDAKAMQLEVLGVYLKYLQRGGAQRYMARVSFAPMLENDAPFTDRDLTER
jgi:hypothetical protein